MLKHNLLRATGEPDPAWDLFYAKVPGWDISKAVFVQSFSVAAQETWPQGIFFKPDGRKMYIVGNSGDDVNEYNISTAWNVSTASFVQSFSVAAQETAPYALFFKPDGLKMYMIGATSDAVHEYNLSTAWNISTATFLQSFSVAAQSELPTGIFFEPDGLKMYVLGSSDAAVHEYNLSTAWNVSTALFVQSFSIVDQGTSQTGVFFKPDGLKMYVSNNSTVAIDAYTLSSAWDISTAEFIQSFSVSDQGSGNRGIFFKPDGLKMYWVGMVGDAVYEYTIESFSVFAQEPTPQGLFFKPDGLKMYVVGMVGNAVNEYNLSTAWDVTSAAYFQNFSVVAQEDQSRSVFFKPDGFKMYMIGTVSDAVHEYNLSTAWNVVTATFVQSFSVAAQEITPLGLFFKPDGLKMYVAGLSGKAVHEYNLSTAWNVSTATFVQSFSVAAQDVFPTGIFFKPDGLKMYVGGSTLPDAIYAYTLGTAWDVSTATFVQSFSVVDQETAPTGLFFKPDGLKMYVSGPGSDATIEYAFSLG